MNSICYWDVIGLKLLAKKISWVHWSSVSLALYRLSDYVLNRYTWGFFPMALTEKAGLLRNGIWRICCLFDFELLRSSASLAMTSNLRAYPKISKFYIQIYHRNSVKFVLPLYQCAPIVISISYRYRTRSKSQFKSFVHKFGYMPCNFTFSNVSSIAYFECHCSDSFPGVRD